MMARLMLNLQEVKTDGNEDSRSQQDVSRVELDTVWTSDLATTTPSIQSVLGFQSVL
jgi:hypothetical protein